MEFRILGPAEVWVWGQQVDAGPPRQRGVLAALAIDAGRPVSMATLVDRVWGDARTERTRHTLHVYVGRIRRLLEQSGGEVQLLHRSGGYLLQADPDNVDLLRFRRLAEQARDAGLPDERRSALLRAALNLWRGDALADVPGEWAERVREGWQQQRIDALVGWAQLELRLGRAHLVIGPVTEMISDHPLAESLVAVQIRALHAAGRGAEALATYDRLRHRLAAQLGADPGPELRALHRAILRGELTPEGGALGSAPAPRTPGSAPASSRTDERRERSDRSEEGGGDATKGAEPARAEASASRPAQLPLDVYGFTGRSAELAELDALLERSARQPTSVVIAALSGPAGVGKTALAVHWAHRVSDRFPDGQLHVNLRGFDPTGSALTAAEAVRGFLDALQAPPQRIPAGLDAQIGLYRSLMAGRRMLVILDNARDADHVRPLLPGTAGCLVVVTSRNQLPGLVAAEGAHPLSLGLLPPHDARELLTRRMGPDRVAAEPPAVESIISGCAGLPLALAVVAARAATHPGFQLAALADELRYARTDLDAFTAGDLATDVRSVFSWSYRALDPAAARLFRLLGLHPGPDIAVPAAASLAGLSRRQAAHLLSKLAYGHLVTEQAPGRFGLHDLLRAYASELTGAEDPAADRDAALHRLVDHYVESTGNADRRLDSSREKVALSAPATDAAPEDFCDADEAMAWFRAEHPVLLAVLRLAEAAGYDAQTCQLAWAVSTFLDRQGHWHDLTGVHSTALNAALRLGDRRAQAVIHRGLALSGSRFGRYDDAATHCRRALELYREIGDHLGQARANQNLSWVRSRQERHQEALDHALAALPLFRAAEDLAGQASALNMIGWFRCLLGDHDLALTACGDALELYEKMGNPGGVANTWDSVGYAHHQLGSYAEAVGAYGRAIDLFRTLGDRYGEADTLGHLGDSLLAAGTADEARAAWLAALQIFTELGHADAAEIRVKLERLDIA